MRKKGDTGVMIILTKKQQAIAEYIHAFVEKEGRVPNTRETAEGMGKGVTTIYDTVKRMVERGWDPDPLTCPVCGQNIKKKGGKK